MAEIYLYLTKRDKTGVRLLAKFQGRELLPTRLDDLSLLGLPITWELQLGDIIFNSRMLWEPWAESSDTFIELRTNLKKRGYSNVPSSSQLEFNDSNTFPTTINISKLPKKKIMLRKN